MGDRHGGRFARRGRALNPPRPQVDAHRGVGFRWHATVFRCRGAVGRICPAQERSPRRKASRHSAKAKGFAPRRNTPLGESLPTRHEGERIYPRENAPLGEGLPTRRTSERVCPRENTPLGEGLPTRREGERICPAGFAFAPRADERRAALGRQTAEKHPFGGVAPTARGRCRVHSPKKNKTTP